MRGYLQDIECNAVPLSGAPVQMGTSKAAHEVYFPSLEKNREKNLNGDLYGSKERKPGGGVWGVCFLSKAAPLKIGNNLQNSFLKCCFDILIL